MSETTESGDAPRQESREAVKAYMTDLLADLETKPTVVAILMYGTDQDRTILTLGAAVGGKRLIQDLARSVDGQRVLAQALRDTADPNMVAVRQMADQPETPDRPADVGLSASADASANLDVQEVSDEQRRRDVVEQTAELMRDQVGGPGDVVPALVMWRRGPDVSSLAIGSDNDVAALFAMWWLRASDERRGRILTAIIAAARKASTPDTPLREWGWRVTANLAWRRIKWPLIAITAALCGFLVGLWL